VSNQQAQLQASGMTADNALRAALSNQGVDVTRAQQNLGAQMQAQDLSTRTGMEAALANLSAAQQTQVQNMAAQLQTQGMNADQSMRAALANQQTGFNVGQQNLQSLLATQQLGAQTGLQAQLANQQYGLEAQRLAEQSRQFGAQNQLQGFAQANQSAQTLGNLGQLQQQTDLQRLQAQGASAAEIQALDQRYKDQQYADFLRQRDYPLEQLSMYNNVLRGLPITPSSTQTTYAPSPSFASQALGGGLSALSMSRAFGG
jgi:hypothetical protein